ncbi:oxidoreductase [Candidatus Koribacter versatilis Ellin345]|uniref:Oxidoreductase n=1 Tax=Koribacter versatilis (strain Ellin345) TaxID=204669 RepID=Q1IKE7_KORVE|nr:Gfo/Idh/MocA family oxidoreductase [Candidatus Koribacter versatilis]ABF42653.1 oxidoreductase [Candidatus Koribacter versatilis Ellin345]
MPTSKVRFGIVGFGLHAVKRLMPAFGIAEHSEVVALSRRDAARARASAEQFGIANAFASVEELAHCAEVDAVFIASPDALHLHDTLVCLRAGKPVLCEKPMAMNAMEAEQMVGAAKSAALPLGVAQVFRFEDSTRRLRERVRNGNIGRPVLARTEFCYPGIDSARTWITDPTLATGGPIADVGVHCIDALRFILGDEVTAVSCTAVKDELSEPVECAGVVTLEFMRKTLATVSVSTRAQYRTFIEITGETGVLTAFDALNVERPLTIEYRPHADPRQVEREEVSNQLAYARQLDAFAATVRGESAFPAPGSEGQRNQQILDAAYASWRSGQRQVLQS